MMVDDDYNGMRVIPSDWVRNTESSIMIVAALPG